MWYASKCSTKSGDGAWRVTTSERTHLNYFVAFSPKPKNNKKLLLHCFPDWESSGVPEARCFSFYTRRNRQNYCLLAFSLAAVLRAVVKSTIPESFLRLHFPLRLFFAAFFRSPSLAQLYSPTRPDSTWFSSSRICSRRRNIYSALALLLLLLSLGGQRTEKLLSEFIQLKSTLKLPLPPSKTPSQSLRRRFP